MKLRITQPTFCAAILCFLASHSMRAQSFEPGSIVVNGGIGIGSSISYLGYGVHRTPVISATGEYGLVKLGPGTLGAGLAFGYQSASYTDNSYYYYYKYKWTTTMFGLRGTYHPDFLNTDKYDVYGAVQLSFDHFSQSWTSSDPYANLYFNNQRQLSSYARFYLLVGARYYFTQNFGVFAELGYDISYLKLGITLKFKGPDPKLKD